jgi:hypothetical protein
MRVGGQFHAPAALPPGKRPSTHFIGGWVGPGAGLDEIRSADPPTRSESLLGGESWTFPWSTLCEDKKREKSGS